jgi:hypothetical protein
MVPCHVCYPRSRIFDPKLGRYIHRMARRPFTSPPNDAVTHSLRTVKRHVVYIEIPTVREDTEESYELRFHEVYGDLNKTITVNKAELGNLIRVLLKVRADTEPSATRPVDEHP